MESCEMGKLLREFMSYMHVTGVCCIGICAA
jgi:hypothetical protein